MNFNEFIFSHQRKYRLRRHLAFWTVWCIYFAITFLVPTYWVPAWNLRGPMPQIEKYGVGISIFRILMNSVLMTLVHMFLVYGIIYYFLPGYTHSKKNRLSLTALLVLFIIFVACFNYLNFLMTFSISTWMGYFTKMPNMEYIIPVWIRQIVFNYPTIIGFALAIKLLKRWYIKQKETEQLIREKINAELQLLKGQIHPHFLFNTLNNIYSFILNDSELAPEMIKKLSSLLNYILNDCNRQWVPLEKEISMLQDYIALEQIRYGDRLNLSLQIQGTTRNKMISPLLLIPFVENSFKHGTSRMLTHPWVRLSFQIDSNYLDFSLINNKPEYYSESFGKKGIGLRNVKKRLELLYPETHTLRIVESEMSFEVQLKIKLYIPGDDANAESNVHQIGMYELA
jgi:sensor histidine kinase YesM